MRLTLPIQSVIQATPRALVVTLDLCGAEFRFEAGQAVAVTAPREGKKRYYSLACSPAEARATGRLELLVGFDPAKAADAVSWTREAEVDVEGPMGRFTFPAAPAGRRFMFVAGGTGIAPLRAMMRSALETPNVEIGVLYSARSPHEFAYQDELHSLAASGRISLRQTVTRDTNHDDWCGGRGRIGVAELEALAPLQDALVFICGPRAFVDDTRHCLANLGTPRERIRIEEW